MVQQTASGTIATGACVRVSGKGRVDKGKITASTVAITMPTSGTCTRPGAGNGAGPGSGPGGGGSVPDGGSIPSGSNPRRGNARRSAGIAFGSVQSVKGNNIVVARFTRGRQSAGSQTPPKATTKNVKVTLSSSTKVTQLVSAAQTDLTTGQCVSAAGTGDSEAITAQRVTISQPQNGSCS
jgi:hypothetical protein